MVPYPPASPALPPLAALCLAAALAAQAQTRVVVDPGAPRQSFEGWGTSLCWWAHDLGETWNAAGLEALTTLVADSAMGLGMNIFRYNIGGGDQPGHAHMRADADVPGWKTSETGAYDWNADPGQRKVMALLRRKVRNPIWEAFANSPPWWMTKSGCASGNTDGSNNLKDDYYDDFAEYLTAVTQRLQATDSVVFRTLTPFNEPNSDWWTANGRQEGCRFERAVQPRMIQEVGARIQSKGLTGTSVSAADANSIGEMVANARAYDAATRAHITQYNAHSYHGTDADRRAMAEVARSQGMRLWQSETGPLSWPGGNQFDVAMWSADLILKDLREMQAEAWLDWQVAGGGIWGVIDYTRSNQTSRMNKKGFAYAQFTRFVRPGSRILASDHAATLAALVPASGSLVLVVANTGASAASYSFDLSRFPVLPQTAEAYRTSSTEDVAALPSIPLSAKTLVVQTPSRSVTTLVLRGASGPTLAVRQPPTSAAQAAQLGRPLGLSRQPTPWFLPLDGSAAANALGRRP